VHGRATQRAQDDEIQRTGEYIASAHGSVSASKSGAPPDTLFV
jgi:hypothetical protein